MKEVFEKAILTYGQTAQEAVENRRQYKVRRLENRLKEAPACSK